MNSIHVILAIFAVLSVLSPSNAVKCPTHTPGNATLPDIPSGVGSEETAPVADNNTILPYVDYAYTNQRGQPCYANLSTNAGVRVLKRFLDVWKPTTLIVDAGVNAAASGSCPAIVASNWTGIPGDATDGTVLNQDVHKHNLQYCVDVTSKRTAAQALAAYLDDRRGKGYSISDGMGPLTNAYRKLGMLNTTITSMPDNATTVLYNEGGNDIGVGGAANPDFGTAIDFVSNIGENGSTEPAKRFYKYARPWRWSSDVIVVPQLVPAKSSTPATDGGQPSGHTAEGVRKAIAMAYLIPERYQEMVARALELGENRILAGMHSPLDVIGGRIQSTAVAAASIATGANKGKGPAASDFARKALMAAVGASDFESFLAAAHTSNTSVDRFADYSSNKAEYIRRLTYGFSVTGDTSKVANVPKRAEVLLETRLPYLTDAQRRVVLKTTAVSSGYPLLDDDEGWGRLNLFAAADGYGAFNGDVDVTMNVTLGGFNAIDTWKNDISGAGKLTKRGTGSLTLSGSNSYSGGTVVVEGTLKGTSGTAFGVGDVYVSGGTLSVDASSSLTIGGQFSQTASGSLSISIGASNKGQLKVKGAVNLAGGSLVVSFKSGYTPKAGDTIRVLTTSSFKGSFSSITVAGFKASAKYRFDSLDLTLSN